MFEVRITKFAAIRVEAEDEVDALLKVVEMDLKCRWSESWECKQLEKEEARYEENKI